MAAKKSTATTAPQTMKSVKALLPIEHDGVLQEVGDIFEVREEDLQQLLEVNAVALVESKDAPAA